jgi:hypothetical protein
MRAVTERALTERDCAGDLELLGIFTWWFCYELDKS